MNRENLLRVADAIEKHEIKGLGYNQSKWWSKIKPDQSGHNCGTTACIAGWAFAVATMRPLSDTEGDEICRVACAWLELGYQEECRLFQASPLDGDPSSFQAVRTLRYAAEHGVIDWCAANAEAAS